MSECKTTLFHGCGELHWMEPYLAVAMPAIMLALWCAFLWFVFSAHISRRKAPE